MQNKPDPREVVAAAYKARREAAEGAGTPEAAEATRAAVLACKSALPMDVVRKVAFLSHDPENVTAKELKLIHKDAKRFI